MTSVSYLIPEAAMVGIPTACTMPIRKSETHCNTLQHTAQRELGCQTHTADTATHCTMPTSMSEIHCSMLYCNTPQHATCCIATHYKTPHNDNVDVKHTTTHCTVPTWMSETHYNTLYCNALHHVHVDVKHTLLHTAKHRHTLQHCTTLKHTAPHWNTLHSTDLNVRNTLQHTVLQCNTQHSANMNAANTLHENGLTHMHEKTVTLRIWHPTHPHTCKMTAVAARVGHTFMYVNIYIKICLTLESYTSIHLPNRGSGCKSGIYM